MRFFLKGGVYGIKQVGDCIFILLNFFIFAIYFQRFLALIKEPKEPIPGVSVIGL